MPGTEAPGTQGGRSSVKHVKHRAHRACQAALCLRHTGRTLEGTSSLKWNPPSPSSRKSQIKALLRRADTSHHGPPLKDVASERWQESARVVRTPALDLASGFGGQGHSAADSSLCEADFCLCCCSKITIASCEYHPGDRQHDNHQHRHCTLRSRCSFSVSRLMSTRLSPWSDVAANCARGRLREGSERQDACSGS